MMSDHQPHIVPSRRDVELMEMQQEIERLREHMAKRDDVIHKLTAQLAHRCNAECCDKEELLAENKSLRADWVNFRRLLREAVLRDGLVDERWFREAALAAGGSDAQV
jgi:hypothetical protein